MKSQIPGPVKNGRLIYSHEDAGIALKENVSDDARRFARISRTPLSKCLADEPLLDAFVPNDVEVFFDCL